MSTAAKTKQETTDSAAKPENQKVELGLLEEDDEFEEFEADDWNENDKDNENQEDNLWEDNWDDDNVEDDFTNQLRF
jgi:26 proteasome complex subunit DSS1